jgi:hypothetical protein
MLTGVRVWNICETSPAPRLNLPGGAPLQPPMRRLTHDEIAGNMQGPREEK